jgi:hypothetical protein
MHQKETLLQQMQHPVANNQQIIAGILLLKTPTVQSEETRLHLRDTHQRVMSGGGCATSAAGRRYRIEPVKQEVPESSGNLIVSTLRLHEFPLIKSD